MDRKDDVALSPREHEVLQLVATGRTNVQIASQLSVTENSVKTLLRRALTKLGTPDRASAVAEGSRRGLLQ